MCRSLPRNCPTGPPRAIDREKTADNCATIYPGAETARVPAARPSGMCGMERPGMRPWGRIMWRRNRARRSHACRCGTSTVFGPRHTKLVKITSGGLTSYPKTPILAGTQAGWRRIRACAAGRLRPPPPARPPVRSSGARCGRKSHARTAASTSAGRGAWPRGSGHVVAVRPPAMGAAGPKGTRLCRGMSRR